VLVGGKIIVLVKMAVKFNRRREFDILETEMGVFNCSADPEIYGIFASSKKQPSSNNRIKI
jgi:hypothetical protein